MTPKQRMKLAMACERPDRVPLMCQLSLGHIHRNLHMDPVRFWYTSEGLAEAFITMAERYRFDGILVNTYGRNPKIMQQIKSVEPHAGGHLLVWENGDETFLPPNDDPRYLKHREPAHRPTDIGDIDVDSIPVIESPAELPDYCMDILKHVIRRKGADLAIHGEIGTAFERLLVLFDAYSDGLMALMDNPEKCKAIMDRINRSCIAEAKAQCELGIDVLKLSSPFAGAGFISREMYREFVLPYEREVISVANGYGIPCYIHTCGSIGDRLDLMLETGTQGLECLDPPPLGNVDLAAAVEQIGGNAFIKGNLDSVNELLWRTPDEVMEIARKRIEVGMQCKSGFILSTACSVAPGVPPENIEVLYDAVERYGRY